MSSKVEMTPEEREAKEQEEFSTGPLKVLTDSVKNNTQVLINCRYVLLIAFEYYKVKITCYAVTIRSYWGG